MTDAISLRALGRLAALLVQAEAAPNNAPLASPVTRHSSDAGTDSMQAHMLSILQSEALTRSHRLTPAAAFTLIELLLVVAIVGVLATLALPQFQNAIELARVAKAIGDIEAMQTELSSLDALPTSLVAIDRTTFLDPWGRPYVYLKLEGTKGNTGKARKDHFLVPLNSDYDLYSMGKDGASAAPLTAKASADDVIRANNGGFIGLAARY